MVMLSAAEAAHIPVRSEIAQWDDFPRFMASLPEKAQYQYVAYQLDQVDRGAGEAARMDAEWARGDLRSYEAAADDMRRRYPDLFIGINAARNGRWVDRIETMLAAGGVHFISVGLFHTLGAESIQAQLRRRGLPVHRVEPPQS